MASPSAYLAGPDVFLRDAREKAETLRAICARYGIEARFPLDAPLELGTLSKSEQGLAISRANEELIRRSDGVLANMTPFRGPSTDVGTAVEIGFAHALGKPIVGYTERDPTYRERLIAHFGQHTLLRGTNGALEDPNGMGIEDFDLVDNLMLDGAVLQSGGRVIRPSDVQKAEISVFEGAVRMLAGLFSLSS